jgi:hypothetical protein
MRFRTVVTAVVLCLAALPAVAQQTRVEQIPLKHVSPAEVAEQLRRALPEGVTQVEPYDLTNSLLVAGTEAGIAALRQMVSGLDIPPVCVRVESDIYLVAPEALASIPFSGVTNPRGGGIAIGPAADKLVETIKRLVKDGLAGGPTTGPSVPAGTEGQPAAPKLSRTLISPRVLAVSGRVACIQSSVEKGPIHSLWVMPVVRGGVVQSLVIVHEGSKEGITYTGRMASEFVTVPAGQRVVLWLAPTKDAPNDLVVVLRFVVMPAEPLTPLTSRQSDAGSTNHQYHKLGAEHAQDHR